jgi:hypothetical protein
MGWLVGRCLEWQWECKCKKCDCMRMGVSVLGGKGGWITS